MKVFLRFFAVFTAFLLIFSCVTKQDKGKQYLVYVSDSKTFELLPPSAFEENMDRFQNITGYFQGKVHIFGAYIKSSEAEVYISFFNQMGGSAGELHYTGDSLKANSHFSPQGTKFEYMMADFQFCYCQKELLSASLEAAGLRFDVTAMNGKEIRQIWDKDQLIIQVEKDKTNTRLQNYLRNYYYDILEGF